VHDNLNSINDLSDLEHLTALHNIDITAHISEQLNCVEIKHWHERLADKFNATFELPKH